MLKFSIILLTGLGFFLSLSACAPRQRTATTASYPPPQQVEAEPNPAPTGESADRLAGSYIPYTASAYTQSPELKRVLFFHAAWCPFCKAADQVFRGNLGRIPSDVVLFKTDYDTEKALKARYGVTYQHTFVWVDSAGERLKIWNGGDIEELISNTR